MGLLPLTASMARRKCSSLYTEANHSVSRSNLKFYTTLCKVSSKSLAKYGRDSAYKSGALKCIYPNIFLNWNDRELRVL